MNFAKYLRMSLLWTTFGDCFCINVLHTPEKSEWKISGVLIVQIQYIHQLFLLQTLFFKESYVTSKINYQYLFSQMLLWIKQTQDSPNFNIKMPEILLRGSGATFRQVLVELLLFVLSVYDLSVQFDLIFLRLSVKLTKYSEVLFCGFCICRGFYPTDSNLSKLILEFLIIQINK